MVAPTLTTSDTPRCPPDGRPGRKKRPAAARCPSQGVETLEMLVHGTLPDIAPAGERYLGPAKSGQQRAHHVIAARIRCTSSTGVCQLSTPAGVDDHCAALEAHLGA